MAGSSAYRVADAAGAAASVNCVIAPASATGVARTTLDAGTTRTAPPYNLPDARAFSWHVRNKKVPYKPCILDWRLAWSLTYASNHGHTNHARTRTAAQVSVSDHRSQ